MYESRKTYMEWEKHELQVEPVWPYQSASVEWLAPLRRWPCTQISYEIVHMMSDKLVIMIIYEKLNLLLRIPLSRNVSGWRATGLCYGRSYYTTI